MAFATEMILSPGGKKIASALREMIVAIEVIMDTDDLISLQALLSLWLLLEE